MNEFDVPPQTVIYFSKIKVGIGFLVGAGVIAVALFLMISRNEYVSAGIFFATGMGITFITYKQFKNRQPQIIINDRGIETTQAGFYPWEEIGNEMTTCEHRDKDTIYCLEYDCPNGHEELRIGDMDISSDQLAYLLHVYRQRSGKKYKYDKSIFN